MDKILKAVILKLDVFESEIIHEKNFSIAETEEAKLWFIQHNINNNVCICREIPNDIIIE